MWGLRPSARLKSDRKKMVMRPWKFCSLSSSGIKPPPRSKEIIGLRKKLVSSGSPPFSWVLGIFTLSERKVSPIQLVRNSKSDWKKNWCHLASLLTYEFSEFLFQNVRSRTASSIKSRTEIKPAKTQVPSTLMRSRKFCSLNTKGCAPPARSKVGLTDQSRTERKPGARPTLTVWYSNKMPPTLLDN